MVVLGYLNLVGGCLFFLVGLLFVIIYCIPGLIVCELLHLDMCVLL